VEATYLSCSVPTILGYTDAEGSFFFILTQKKQDRWQTIDKKGYAEEENYVCLFDFFIDIPCRPSGFLSIQSIASLFFYDARDMKYHFLILVIIYLQTSIEWLEKFASITESI
jgi:hypothetical protein